jgi:aldehyde:ferredoxin oxidoreductase
MISVTQFKDFFNAVTGYGWDIDEMMKTAARIWFLQRCLGHIWGATGADDRIGQKIMTPVEDGMTAGVVPDMDRMLREFYEYRGIGEDGKPTRETLEKYGLGELAGKI